MPSSTFYPTTMLSHEDSEAWSVAMELHDQPNAEQQLGSAIQTALDDQNTELEGQARTALGIYYQHQGRIDDARAFLEHAVTVVAPTDADYAAAQFHLDSLNSDVSCGCREHESEVARYIRHFVLSRIPEGLISHFAADVKADGNVTLDVEVTRELNDEEEQLVNATIDEALAICSE